MKKHIWITTGVLLISVPVVSTFSIKARSNRNSVIVVPSLHISLGDNDEIFESIIGDQNKNVKGELESVTYLAKSKDKKERLLVYLNNNHYLTSYYYLNKLIVFLFCLYFLLNT